MSMELKISSMETQIPSSTGLYKRQSTLQVFDEVKQLMDDMKLGITDTDSWTESESEVPVERNSNMLLFPGELPAYLGRCYTIGPTDFLGLPDTPKVHKKPKLQDDFNGLIQKCFWRIPMKDMILSGLVRKTGEFWDFYWNPEGSLSTSSKLGPLILTATKFKQDGQPCYEITTGFSHSKNIVAKLEGNSKLSKFSLYENGLNMDSLIEMHNNEGLDLVEMELDTDDEEYNDMGSRFIVKTRRELGIILISRDNCGSFWKPAGPKKLTLLLPHFKQRVKLHGDMNEYGLDAFSTLDWRSIPSASIWEKFAGQMTREFRDMVEDKNLVVGIENDSSTSGSDGFFISVEKLATNNEYQLQFRSPLCLCHAFALALTAIETNFK